ncbi:MAG: glycosyltransferase [Candidatus Binatia bacterium]|nr:glycosyltransferase [Candidatus Binatia bacterium]
MNRQELTASPLVTIAIPTYNRADGYLRQALESACRQTYPHLEILVADNCSTDHTAALVASLGDPRIRYVRHPVNIGAARNFNFCVQEAKGDYFLLLCDDDLIDADFVETCLAAVRPGTDDIGIICTGVRVIDANDRVIYECPNMAGGCPTADFFCGWFSGKTAIYLCNTLFRTARLRDIGGFQSRHYLYDDSMAVMRLAATYGRIDIPHVKASARLHHAQLGFASRVGDWCEESLLLLELMCALVPDRQDTVRQAGRRFFARANYSRAQMVQSSFQRLLAYWLVFRTFRCLPSFYHLYPQRLQGLRTKVKHLLGIKAAKGRLGIES